MKNIVLFVLLPLLSLSQDIKFEKTTVSIMRSFTKDQNVNIKIVQKDSDFVGQSTVEIYVLKGDDIKISPSKIKLDFNSSTPKEYIFSCNLKKSDDSLKAILPSDDEIIELKYNKNGHEIREQLVININPYKKEEKEDELSDDFPDFILFAGTNIDPLGENTVSSASFNLERNFKLKNTLGIQFGLYTNKNLTKDSSRVFQNHQFVTDRTINDKTYLYTQTFSTNTNNNTRTNGGYLNLTKQMNGTDAKTKYFLLGGIEIAFRKYDYTISSFKSTIDSTLYTNIDRNRPYGSSKLTQDRILIPSKILNQIFANFGFRIENNVEKIYLVIQPSVSYTISSASILNRSSITKQFTTGIRTFIAYKPINISALIDLKLQSLNSYFINFSVGFPLDVKNVFEKKK